MAGAVWFNDARVDKCQQHYADSPTTYGVGDYWGPDNIDYWSLFSYEFLSFSEWYEFCCQSI